MGRVSDYYDGLIEYLYGTDLELADRVSRAALTNAPSRELPKQPKPQEKDSKGE